MKLIALAAVSAALLAGCGASEEAPAPPSENSAPIASASFEMDEGTCAKCHSEVYDGHVCGRTRPCRMCAREAGPGHRHTLVWNCAPCNRTYVATHVCTDARTCPTCRLDGVRRMPPKACTGCGAIITAIESRSATSYCAECSVEVAAGHIHGKTTYCAACEREAGANHIHNATILCAECASETAPDHQHGVTAFCASCGRDQGLDHKHGRTAWCLKCKSEKVDPHTVHTDAR